MELEIKYLNYLSEEDKKKYQRYVTKYEKTKKQLLEINGSGKEIYEENGIISKVKIKDNPDLEKMLNGQFAEACNTKVMLEKKAQQSYLMYLVQNPEKILPAAEEEVNSISFEEYSKHIDISDAWYKSKVIVDMELSSGAPEWRISPRSIDHIYNYVYSRTIFQIIAVATIYRGQISVEKFEPTPYYKEPTYIGEGQPPELFANLKRLWLWKTQELFDQAQNYQSKDVPGLSFNGKSKEEYRTKGRAGEVAALPNYLAFITLPELQYGVSLKENDTAFLFPIDKKNVDNLQFDNGRLKFIGKLDAISEAELKDLRTKEPITEIDVPLLKEFYSLFLEAFRQNGEPQEILDIYVPEFISHLGGTRNQSQEKTEEFIKKVQSFHNIAGFMPGKADNRTNIYPVLNFEGYNADKNILSVSSPYFNMLIKYVISMSEQKAKVLKTKTGQVQIPPPSHSYLAKPTLTKCRSKVAVENVFIILAVIEQAGTKEERDAEGNAIGKKGTPHISAKTLMERNPQFAEGYKSSKNKYQYLRRVFNTTFKLLKEDTRLLETYKNIKIPSKDSVTYIPTPTTLDTTVLKFPHEGKL